jgi:sulfatase modifying factor 1
MKAPFYLGSKFLPLLAVVFLLLGKPSAHAKREIEGQVFIVTKESQNVKLGLVPIWVLGDSEMKTLAKQAVELADAVHFQTEMETFEKKFEKKFSELESKARKELGDESAQKVKKAKESERATMGKWLETLSVQIARGKGLLKKISQQERGIDAGEIATKVAFDSEFSVKILIALLAERESDAESDADGRFKVSSENSGGYIVAYSQRTVGKSATFGSVEDAERYYWVAELPQRKNQLFLSNNNSDIIGAEARLRVLATGGEGTSGVSKKFSNVERRTPFVVSGEAEKTYEEEKARVEMLISEKERIASAERAEKEKVAAIERMDKEKASAAEVKERREKAFTEGRLLLDEAGRSLFLIPKGKFQMGSSDGSLNERPVHEVNVSAFYIGETEVSFGEWQEVMEWAKVNGYDFSRGGRGTSAKHPVTNVSWYDVVKWCNAKSQKEGLTPCYKASGEIYRKGEENKVTCDWNTNGYRLPTEAEWEKAARGGLVGKKYPDGDSLTKSDANIEGSGTMEVGKYSANGYGLYDMAGNVLEWCWDWYGTPYAGRDDPRGPSSGLYRVLRGGSWYKGTANARNAERNNSTPSSEGDYYGFRLARGRL